MSFKQTSTFQLSSTDFKTLEIILIMVILTFVWNDQL